MRQRNSTVLNCILTFLVSVLQISSTLANSDESPITQLEAVFSQHGLRGNVTFEYAPTTEEGNAGHTLKISIKVESFQDVTAAPFSWSIHELPVDYTKPVACDKGTLGERVSDLSQILGQVILPVNSTVELKTDQLNITGPNSIWGRTLVFDGGRTLCATIMPIDGLKTTIARLPGPVSGTVTVMSWSVGNVIDNRILTDLYHTGNDLTASNHVWKLMVTDVLDTQRDKDRENCNALQFLYDPDFRSGENCSPQQPESCKLGDLSGRYGLVRVASKPGAGFGGGSRRVFRDSVLHMPDLSGPRSLFVVLFDKDHPDSVLACGKFRDLQMRQARAYFERKGVRGEIFFEQRSNFDPTRVLVNLTGLNGLAGGFHVHEYPVPISRNDADLVCSATANHYNPWGWDPKSSPPPGRGSAEVYELGDLSGKFGLLTGLSAVENEVSDVSLPLFGPYSIVGRAVVIHLASDGSRWVCTNIEPVGEKIISAVAVFRYPLTGRIIFRQMADDPFAETSIYIESLIYSDGSQNVTQNHKLEIHDNPPNEDYHEWRQRCKSTGPIYNPFKISEKGSSDCSRDNQRRCAVGELSRKHGVFEISGTLMDLKRTKHFYTDIGLPLSGPNSILGRSVVIIDDESPQQRGNRLACTTITRYYRYKAVVKDWFANGIKSSLNGRVEFVQETEFSSTAVSIDLVGLQGEAGQFGIYVAPVSPDLQFPCTADSIGALYNPLKANVSSSFSSSTPDKLAVGHLSAKFGNLTDFKEIHTTVNDTTLPLFGPTSILGRSFLVNRQSDNERWVCGTLGWGFSPAEAYQIRAIASFHHPGGFAYGYVRMTQVIYKDGGSTDTIVEVNLRHPGSQSRDVTRNHRWAVFVNPVGQDAAVASFNSRCVAAGYPWNPTFIQITDPNNEEAYRRDCSPITPYRCMVGDISGRLGTIDVGAGRYVFSDSNLPLSGKYSVMGRSIVLYTPDGGNDRFACANIQPDNDIFKFVVIRKPPKFVVADFVTTVRRVLGVPHWMLQVDNRETRELQNGRCIQFKILFNGPSASRIEQDLSVLLNKLPLDNPSIQVPGAHLDPKRPKTIPYQVCSESDSERANPTSGTDHVIPGIVSLLAVVMTCLYT